MDETLSIYRISMLHSTYCDEENDVDDADDNTDGLKRPENQKSCIKYRFYNITDVIDVINRAKLMKIKCIQKYLAINLLGRDPMLTIQMNLRDQITRKFAPIIYIVM